MKRISYWWMLPALGSGALLWWLAYREVLSVPLMKYNLAHRLCVAGGLIIMILSVFRQHGKPLRERLRGYYRATLPAVLFTIIIGGYQHWFMWPYFSSSPARISSDGFILQSTGLSCAPASIANLARLYGKPGWEGELAITMRMPFTGSTIGEIGRGLDAYGFEFTDTHTTVAELRRNNRPCLISIWLLNGVEHSCVLLAMTDEMVWIIDPLQGQRVLTMESFLQCWSERATFAAPPGLPSPYEFSRPFALAAVPGWLSPCPGRAGAATQPAGAP